MGKTYILQKGLPGKVEIGERFVWCDRIGEYVQERFCAMIENDGNPGITYHFTAGIMENESFFKEDKPERIEVNVGGVSWVENGPEKLLVVTSPLCPIREDKFPAIKKAIEFVLNSDPQDIEYGHYLYTQEDMNRAREAAFNAARMLVDTSSSHQCKLFKILSDEYSENGLFKTSQHYLKSLQP